MPGYCPLDVQEEAGAQVESQKKMAVGCPVQYCGTTRQKAANALLDIGIHNAIEEYKFHQHNKLIAGQNEDRARPFGLGGDSWVGGTIDCGPAGLGCAIGDAANGVNQI